MENNVERTKEHLADSVPEKGGIVGDMQRLKEDGGASLAELREFVGNMHGKSPQEMLGVLAQSRLAINIAISAVGCAVLMIAWSALAFYWPGSNDDSAKKQMAEKTSSQSNLAPTKTSPAATTKTTIAATGTGKTGKAKSSDIAKRLGIKETKTGVPNLDNLLDGNK